MKCAIITTVLVSLTGVLSSAVTPYRRDLFTYKVRSLSEAEKRAQANDIARFEERYLQSRTWRLPNSTVKLVGFQRANLDERDLDEIEAEIRAEPKTWHERELDGLYYDHVAREVRVYFPIRDAMVYHRRELVEASEDGELPHESVDGDLAIIGRRYVEGAVHGDASNVIRDNIVHLHQPNQVLHARGNVHIYDFGKKLGHDHDHDHGHDHEHGPQRRYNDHIWDKNYGCYRNHANQICTFAYPEVKQGRCGTPHRSETKCRDYNGWWPLTNCGGKSKRGFLGSDCYYALKHGHCWNEAASYGYHGDK